MPKRMKTKKGKDNLYYPCTSPDLVIDDNGESQTTKNTSMKTDIDDIKADLGTTQLTTTVKDVKGAVNEVSAECKDIKKYVDDKVTVKILPVNYNKNCITNVIDLEPNSIYMSPNDAKFLYLAYEKLNGTMVGFCFSAKPHGRFIYTGDKDDTKIEIVLEGTCYTAYFKTDTVDAHIEKTVFYLTKNNTIEFTPTNDYEPATKKYVDKQQITDAEIDEAFVENGISSEEMYKITYDLRGMAKISSNMNTIYKNAYYYARINSIDNNIEKPVTVTMGGVDITSTSYKDKVIVIDSVTGDINIVLRGTDRDTSHDPR